MKMLCLTNALYTWQSPRWVKRCIELLKKWLCWCARSSKGSVSTTRKEVLKELEDSTANVETIVVDVWVFNIEPILPVDYRNVHCSHNLLYSCISSCHSLRQLCNYDIIIVTYINTYPLYLAAANARCVRMFSSSVHLASLCVLLIQIGTLSGVLPVTHACIPSSTRPCCAYHPRWVSERREKRLVLSCISEQTLTAVPYHRMVTIVYCYHCLAITTPTVPNLCLCFDIITRITQSSCMDIITSWCNLYSEQHGIMYVPCCRLTT